MMKTPMNALHTHALEELDTAIEEARNTRGVVALVTATSGRGKTTLLRACAADDLDVVLYRAEVVNTPRSVLCALLGTLGESWSGRTRGAFILLMEAMRQAGVRVILIDDAQRLARHTLDMLRAVQERSGVGLVLAGTAVLPRQLIQRRPELAHRTVRVHELPTAEEDDAYEFVRDTPSLGRRSFGECVSISQELVALSGGNMRRMQQLLEAAMVRARTMHRPLSAGLLRRVAKDHLAHTLALPA